MRVRLPFTHLRLVGQAGQDFGLQSDAGETRSVSRKAVRKCECTCANPSKDFEAHLEARRRVDGRGGEQHEPQHG